MWQHNVYYVCVTFSVVRYVGLQHTSPHAKIRYKFLYYYEIHKNYAKREME